MVLMLLVQHMLRVKSLQQSLSQLPVISAEAYDFRPDLFTIEHSPPSRWPRALVLGLVGLLTCIGVWIAFAKLDIVASAPGKLVPTSFNKVVQSADNGIVVDILVKDGDTVKEGQVLMRLDARSSQSDMGAVTKEVALKSLTLKRIEAELSERPFLAPAGFPPEVVSQLSAQYRARRQSLADALALEAESLNKAKADLLSANQTLDKLKYTLPLIKKGADAYEKLLKEGFVGDVLANEKRREFVEKEQDVKTQEAIVIGLKSVITNYERKLASVRSSYRTQLENERLEVSTLLNRTQQELSRSLIKEGLLEIRAPNAGIVKDLAITTKGSVVQVGTSLLKIVPQNEDLLAEVLLDNEDAGFVSVGQPVQVKIAAFPFQKYGLVSGKVIHLGADAVAQTQGFAFTQPQSGYRVLVSLERSGLRALNGESFALTAGLLVSAEIHQGTRTVFEYLINPIRKVSSEAGRER
jgi:hemolysin D